MAPIPANVRMAIVATVALLIVIVATYWFLKRSYGSSSTRPDSFPSPHGRRRKPPGGD